MSLLIDLSDKRALITGVTQGIGAGIARKLAAAGADVAGCALAPASDPLARSFVANVEATGRKGLYFDLVVSNAGRNIFRGVDGCSEEDWRECIDLDLASHWRLAKAVSRFFDSVVSPVLVVISSNHVEAMLPGCFPYNVVKAGLTALVQSPALEWGTRFRAVGWLRVSSISRATMHGSIPFPIRRPNAQRLRPAIRSDALVLRMKSAACAHFLAATTRAPFPARRCWWMADTAQKWVGESFEFCRDARLSLCL
jgi:NAD(P)-dependent dehydrogenase (short-subunit alcohol dehydrogenase family)